MRRPSPALKTHTFALIAYILRCLLFSFTPTARLQEFFTFLLSLRRIWWTIELLHLLSISLLELFFLPHSRSSKHFQVLQIFFFNCVVVTLVYSGPVDFSLMTSW